MVDRGPFRNSSASSEILSRVKLDTLTIRPLVEWLKLVKRSGYRYSRSNGSSVTDVSKREKVLPFALPVDRKRNSQIQD